MKSVCPWSNGALNADIAIAYSTHNNCRFGNSVPCSLATSQAIRVFLVVRMCGGKGTGEGKEKIRLVTCARFSFCLPECWQSQSNLNVQSN